MWSTGPPYLSRSDSREDAIFANLPAGQHFHFKSDDPDRIAHAMNRRMEFPEKLALLVDRPIQASR